MQLGRSKVVERKLVKSCRKFKSQFPSLNVASFTVVEANKVAWKYCNMSGTLLFKSIHKFINYSRSFPNDMEIRNRSSSHS